VACVATWEESRDQVGRLVDWTTSRPSTRSTIEQVDLVIRRFYIRLGRHLLDRNFVLNSNNILIY
jgi:hypothetical protein